MRVDLATSAGGAQTTYTAPIENALLWSFVYVPSADPLTTTGDVTITEEDTGAAIWSTSDIGTAILRVMPRAAVVDTTGTALSPAVYDLIPVSGRVKIVIANGGASKTAALIFNFVRAQG